MKNKIKLRYGQRYINVKHSGFDLSKIEAYLSFAELVNDYSSVINHPYFLGDCLLCKLNIIDKRQIKKNPYYKEKK